MAEKHIETIEDFCKVVFDRYNKSYLERYKWGLDSSEPTYLQYGIVLIATYRQLMEMEGGSLSD